MSQGSVYNSKGGTKMFTIDQTLTSDQKIAIMQMAVDMATTEVGDYEKHYQIMTQIILGPEGNREPKEKRL